MRLLIIDEVHLLNDERGPVIETLVARTQRQVRLHAAYNQPADLFLADAMLASIRRRLNGVCCCAGGGQPEHDSHRRPVRHAAKLQGQCRMMLTSQHCALCCVTVQPDSQ